MAKRASARFKHSNPTGSFSSSSSGLSTSSYTAEDEHEKKEEKKKNDSNLTTNDDSNKSKLGPAGPFFGRMNTIWGYMTDVNHRFNLDTLIDAFLALYMECNSSKELKRDPLVADYVKHFEPLVSEITGMIPKRSDFETLKVIGRGAFGEVHLVKDKLTGGVYALKILSKWEMLKRQETACFREERQILLHSQPWLTSMYTCFQDEECLYLLMEYYPGGDLLTLLSKYDGIFDEDMARFYLMEVVLAVESIHKLGFCHRDIKPDNILIDVSGHIKLADFGSCVYLGENGDIRTAASVGTPDYISPEALQAVEGKGAYGKESDWWSVGVMLYELLVGEPPFYNESLIGTYAAIMNHSQSLVFPDDIPLSDEVKDLIRSLLTDKEIRLGRNSASEIKNHKWFKTVNFDKISTSTPPYIPDIKGVTDTSHFDDTGIEDKPAVLDTKRPRKVGDFSGHQLPFIGFSYLRDLHIAVSANNSGGGVSGVGTNKASIGTLSDDSDIKEANLKQMEMYRSQLQEKEMKIAQLEISLKAATTNAQDIQNLLTTERESSKHTTQNKRELEDELNRLKRQIDQLEKTNSEVTATLNLKQKELSDVRATLSVEVNEKENLEMSRKELLNKLEEIRATSDRNEVLRQRAENHHRKLKAEFEELQASTRNIADGGSKGGHANEKELKELHDALDQKENIIQKLNEELEQEYTKHDQEIENLEKKYVSQFKISSQTIQELQIQIETLKSTNESYEVAKENMSKDLESLTSELGNTIEDLYLAQKAKVQLESDLQYAENKIVQLTHSLEETNLKMTNATESIVKLEESEKNLIKKTQRLEGENITKEKTIRSLENELTLLKANLADISQNVPQITVVDENGEDVVVTELESSLEMNRVLKESNRDLVKQLEIIKNNFDNVIKQRDEFSAKNSELEKKVDKLELELTKELAKIKKLTTFNDQQKAEIESIESQLKDAQISFMKSIEALKKNHEAILEESNANLAAAEKAKTSLQTNLDTAINEKHDLERSLNMVRKELERFQKLYAQMEVAMKELESSPVDSTSIKIKELTVQLQASYDDLDAADKEAEELENKVRESRVIIQTLTDTWNGAKAKLEAEILRQKALNHNIELLTLDLEREKLRRETIEIDHERLVEHNKRIELQLKDLQTDYYDMKERLMESERMLQSAQNRVHALQERHSNEIASLHIQQNRGSQDMDKLMKEINIDLKRQKSLQRTASIDGGNVANLQRTLKVSEELYRKEQELNSTLKTQLAELQEQLNYSQKMKAKLEQLIANNEMKTNRESESNRQLIKNNEDLTKELAEIKGTIAEALRNRATAENELRVRDGEVNKIKYELMATQAAKSEMQKQLNHLREELEMEHRSVIMLESSKKRIMKDLEELRDTVFNSADRGSGLNLLKKQIQERDKKLDELLGELEASKKAVTAAREIEISNLQNELGSLKSELQALEEEKNMLENGAKKMWEEYQELQSLLEEKEQIENQLSSIIDEAKHDKMNSTLELQNLQNQHEELLQLLETSQAVNVDFMMQVTELKETLEQQGQKNSRKEEELKQSNERIEYLEKRLAENRNLVSSAVATPTSASSEIGGLTRRPTLRADKAMQQQVRSLQQDLQISLTRKKQLEEDLSKLQFDNSNLAKEVEDLKQKLHEYELQSHSGTVSVASSIEGLQRRAHSDPRSAKDDEFRLDIHSNNASIPSDDNTTMDTKLMDEFANVPHKYNLTTYTDRKSVV